MIPMPKELDTELNQDVLNYLSCASAHGDVSEALLEACAPLGDFHHYCPNQQRFLYTVVFTRATIFGFAIGMDTVVFRLDQEFGSRAIATGANKIKELDGWASFELFRDDRPSVDLKFWALKSYSQVRDRYDT
jgi:hypothetical protein